ncbi:VOC family protein [Kribbella sp. NPDC051952]|uniref:VOC family protein n=1 Tax=Kribbella sp. NPDC051952 TaxID=3154851 RepID=UPI003431398E
MTVHLYSLTFGAHEPGAVAQFWAGMLDRQLADGMELLPNDDTGFRLRFVSSQLPKDRQNQAHFDLTSATLEQQQATVARALELGGQHLDIGQSPEEPHVVMGDPEGNEFCVIEPGNNFLADTAFIGAVSSDGSQQVGYFWSKALDWPLVWDQDEETAIQSPHGGSKISWGGPPVAPKTGPNRLHYDLAPPADGDQQAEVDRLVGLGATRVEDTSHEPGAVSMLDPDGNEFCVLTPR